MLKVGDLMATALITMKPTDTIGRADSDMRMAEIRHLPVVDESGKLVGILSNRDIFKALRRGNRTQVTIREVMSARVFTVREDDPAYRVTELMIEHKIGAVPVVGDDGHLVGLVTETDLLRVADDALRSDY